MAHAITQRADGTFEMAFTGADPWHIGETRARRLPEDASHDDWVEASGMGFEIEETPVLFDTPDGHRQFTGRKVLYRKDTLFPLGDVSTGYKAVQPSEVMGFFEGLTKAAGFKLETAMTLHGGRKYLALARVTDDLPILDHRDKVGGYLLLSTSADGTSATEARWTTVRVVCQNTLSMALRGKASLKVNHRSAFDPDEAKRELGLVGDEAREEFGKAMGTLRELARVELNSHDMIDLTLRTFGYSPERMKADEFRDAMKRKAVNQLALMVLQGAKGGLIGGDMAGVEHTAWGFVNAVTQYVDHMAGSKAGVAGRIDKALLGEGERMKNRAFGLAARRAGVLEALGDEEADPKGFDFRRLIGAAVGA